MDLHTHTHTQTHTYSHTWQKQETWGASFCSVENNSFMVGRRGSGWVAGDARRSQMYSAFIMFNPFNLRDKIPFHTVCFNKQGFPTLCNFTVFAPEPTDSTPLLASPSYARQCIFNPLATAFVSITFLQKSWIVPRCFKD